MATQQKSGTAKRARSRPATGPRAAKAEAEETEAAIVVDGTKYRLGDLTLGELGELEDHVGLPMDAISYGSAKTIAFVVYLVKRRNDPDYTLETAQSIKIDKLGGEGGEVKVGADPT